MDIVILIALFWLVFIDARLLRQLEPSIYQSVMKYKEWQWALFCSAVSLAVLPVYLLRRRRFYRLFNQKPALEESVPLGIETPDIGISKTVLLSDAIGILLIWVLGITCASLFAQVINIFYPDFEKGEMLSLISFSIFSDILMIYLIYRVVQKYPGQNVINFVGLVRDRPMVWKVFIVPVLVGGLFASITATIIFSRPEQPETPLSQIIGSTSSSFLVMIFLGLAVLIAPFLEEIIFRGYFYRVLTMAKSKIFAIVVISLIFGLSHVEQYWGDWMAIVMVALFGFGLTMLRAWSGTTMASIIAHYVYNGGLTILPILMMLVFSTSAYLEYQWNYKKLDFTAKEKLLKRSIEESPDFPPAYNDLAWLYAEEGVRLPEALAFVERALEQEPDNAAYLDTKAEVLYRLGHIEEAIAIEQKLVEESPKDELFSRQLEKFKNSQGK